MIQKSYFVRARVCTCKETWFSHYISLDNIYSYWLLRIFAFIPSIAKEPNQTLEVTVSNGMWWYSYGLDSSVASWFNFLLQVTVGLDICVDIQLRLFQHPCQNSTISLWLTMKYTLHVCVNDFMNQSDGKSIRSMICSVAFFNRKWCLGSDIIFTCHVSFHISMKIPFYEAGLPTTRPRSLTDIDMNRKSIK